MAKSSCYVYKITNKVNKMSYIGVTAISVKWRWEEHKKSAQRGIKKHLYDAMREYGIESFYVRRLETCSDQITMFKRERELIEEYKTLYPGGYNTYKGR